MKYSEERGPDRGYTLSTGRGFYSCSDRLSLDENGKLGYGHDSTVDEFDDEPLTDAEKYEIASEMVRRWMRWAPPPQRVVMIGQMLPGSLPLLYPMPMLREHLRIVPSGSGVRVERITVEGDWVPASPMISTEDEAKRMIDVSFRFEESR